MPRILRLIGSIGFIAVLAAWCVETRTARADECLSQPSSSAPEGSHWYYHTDRATQRKCWYLRAPDQPAQHPTAETTSSATPANSTPLDQSATSSGGAPLSVTPGADTPPRPHIKMLSVVNSGARDKLVQQRAQQQNTTSITATPAPEESTSQTRDQATEPAGAAAIVWPESPKPPIATAQSPIPTPTAAPIEASSTESVQPASDAMDAADDAKHNAQGSASTNSAGGAKASVVIEMSLVAALGLTSAGFMFRIAMTARRRRIIIDRPASHWMSDRIDHELREQRSGSAHQWDDLSDYFVDRPESDRVDHRNQREFRHHQQHSHSGSVHQWDKFRDDLQPSLIPAASDYKPHRPCRNDYESRENPQRSDRDADFADAVSKREDMLEQLRRDLDRLLRSPKVA